MERDPEMGRKGMERTGSADPARRGEAPRPVDRKELAVHGSFEYFQGPIPPPQVLRN